MTSQQNEAAPAGKQPRQLILGCDGTNNTLTGGCHDTNVLKMIGRLVPADADQLVYYDPGVGSPDQVPPLGLWNEFTRRRERVAGMARGKGIYENIEEAYLFLVDHYQPGDQIYIFGFSRGAFTARCVAGMVHLFGIVRPECKSLILTLIRVYFSTPSDSPATATSWWGSKNAEWANSRMNANKNIAQQTGIAADPPPEAVMEYLAKRKERKSTREEVASQVRKKFTSADGKTAAVHFIGVWDTVESVGIPLLSKRSITSTGTTSDKKRLRHIRHAISMDEHRLSFAPRLYWEDDYPQVDGKDTSTSRSLRQRWFRGVHSDVGGGYDVNETALADQAFDWMLREAVDCGLRTGPAPALSARGGKPYIAHDACYDTPWWGVAGLTVRTNVTHETKDGEQRIPVIPEGAAASANARIYSVWSAGKARRDRRFWVAVACAIVLWLVCGAFGHAALHGNASPASLAELMQGAVRLDDWQSTYYRDALRAMWGRHPAPIHPATAAYWAMLADFGFIAAYSWLLGLGASWSFIQMTAHRHPADKVALVFRLGLAPMVAVVADIAEDVLTIFTLWAIPFGTWRPLFPSGMMMAANWLKWIGLAGSLMLGACGLLAWISRLEPLPSLPAGKMRS